MRTTTRVTRGLGALLMAGGALVGASASSATAAEVPAPIKPAAPKLISAEVTGCQAPCAAGETGQVSVTMDEPEPSQPGEIINTVVYFDGVGVHWKSETLGSSLKTYTFTICASRTEPSSECINPITRWEAVRGDETITARSYAMTGNPDDGTQRASELSELSNAIVATQG